MQRPTPLPPPVAPRTEAPVAPRAEARVEEEQRAPRGGIVDEPASRPAPQERPVDAPAEEQDAAPRPVRLRDVWRASRARRRALRAEVRRFTGRARRRRAVWIGGAASVVLLAATTIAVAYSPLFAVERIDVVGTQRLDAAAVRDALSAEIGTPLALVDDSAVKEALVAFPLIESYSLEARPPHDLVLRLVERTPVGVVQSAAGYTLVDAAGVALSTTSSKPEGQPVIDVAAGLQSPAFAAAGLVVRSLPDSIRPAVTAVKASTPDDVTLTLGATRTTIVWGSADDSAEKALVLETMMKKRPPSDVSFYDVSSPKAVVVR